MLGYSLLATRYSNANGRGVVLLLSLLVLAALLTTTITVSTLVVRGLRVTNTSDRGLVAFYAAESGLEQGLYLIRQQKQSGNQLVINQGSAVAQADSKARWWRDSQTVEPQVATNLQANQVVQLELFDPADPLNPAVKARSVKLSWDNNPVSCPNAGPEWLEVASSGWRDNALISATQERYYRSSSQTPAIINLNSNYMNYRMRVKALYADVCSLTIQAFTGLNATGASYSIPARLTIIVTGALADTRQAIAVTVPQYAPQADVFDFTIFSECPLVKGVLGPPAEPTCP